MFSNKMNEFIRNGSVDLSEHLDQFVDSSFDRLLTTFAKYDDSFDKSKLTKEDVIGIMTTDMTSIFATLGKSLLEKKFVSLIKNTDNIAQKSVNDYADSLIKSNYINAIC